jgi:hypothetical protein
MENHTVICGHCNCEMTQNKKIYTCPKCHKSVTVHLYKRDEHKLVYPDRNRNIVLDNGNIMKFRSKKEEK